MSSRPRNAFPPASKIEVDHDLRIAAGELFSAHYTARRLGPFYSPEDLLAFGDAEVLRNAASLAAALHDFYSPLGQKLQATGPDSGHGPGFSRTTPRVVVADDHPAMVDMVVSLLEPEFEIVGTAKDGSSALEAIEKHQPDLAVLDVSMPLLGGIGVAVRLRELDSRARVVFLTAHQDAATLAAAREAGGLGYVLKASLATDLVVALKEALAGRSFVSLSEGDQLFSAGPDPGTI